MTQARSQLVPPGSDGLYHCVQRCVRRAFLCGADQYSGVSFEHRKTWIEQRLGLLAECFAVSIQTPDEDTHNSENPYTLAADFPTDSTRGDGHPHLMTQARSQLVPPGSDGLYHCVQRCVRRAFLCGVDRYSGVSFEHRKTWIEQRLGLLAECFAVSIHAYAVMSNHLHLVVQLVPGKPDRDIHNSGNP